MKNILLFALSLFSITPSIGFQSSEKPKLVVGVVVDQMRYEYLHRFAEHYGEQGFKRLMREGFALKNGHYNYVPTKTAPGHTSIYTGSTPAIHGIIGNDWYDRSQKKEVYCVSDESKTTVGSTTARGKSSPHRLIASTITDELRLSNQMKSKVISISFKDRSAVLPGGHSANAAYWFDLEAGNFITSSYYISQLPEWVNKYNSKRDADRFLKSTWNNKIPLAEYVASRIDNYPLEGKLRNEPTPTFPHKLGKMSFNPSKKYEVLKRTPFANTMVTDLAIEALSGEGLGQGNHTDFLAVSYSATDYVGHKFGPNSIELEDTYLRMDDEITRLLIHLDQKVGKGNYTLFLTADHAVLDMPEYLLEKKMNAGNFDSGKLVAKLNSYLEQDYGEGNYVEYNINLQIYFDWKTVSEKKINTQEFFQKCYRFILAQPGVLQVYSANSMINGDYGEGGIKGSLIRGFNHKRSGDIMLVLEPNWFDDRWDDVSDHGSSYSYDTHVPIIFFGKGIKAGSSVRYHPITDVAPTISTLLNIKFPNGNTGNPIEELFDEE